MFESLPPRPHLNWLKNRAKESLEQFRAANPAVRLADVQRAMAREYGFSSWRKLKAHVELLSSQAGPGDPGAGGGDSPASSPDPATEELIFAFMQLNHGSKGGLAEENIGPARKMLDEHPSLANPMVGGRSLLLDAVRVGSVAAIRLLIERGADPNMRLGNLHTLLSSAVMNNLPQVCQALIEGGAKVDLFCAAGLGQLDAVQSFFDEAGHVRPGASISTGASRRADPSSISELSSDPVVIVSDALSIACRNSQFEVAEYLLEHGADPNFHAYMRATCLHWAYFGGGDPRLVQALIAHGGNPNAIHRIRQCTPRAFGILVTASWGMPHRVKRILDIDPTLVNIFEGGSTPLHEAAEGGNAEVVKILLERGADRTRLNAQGKTALDRAKAVERQPVIALLQA